MDDEKTANHRRRDRYLLARPPLKIPDTFSALTGERVLILGGAGSIGTAIVRAIVAHGNIPVHQERTGPIPVMVADINEESLWRASTQEFGGVPEIEFAVADVAYSEDMERLAEWGPTIVINAAALKHVGFAEGNSGPYNRVNYLGSHVVLTEFYGATIVQISTDKAANPRGVMANSKAKGENAARVDGRVAVRFGNVLGSSGSLLHTWDYCRRNDLKIDVHIGAMRFLMSENEAALIALFAAVHPLQLGGDVIAPALSPTSIHDLALRYCRFYNYPETTIRMTDSRAGDQRYEVMAGRGEIAERIADTDLLHIIGAVTK